MHIDIELAGRFKLIVSNARGSRIAAEFGNLILDQGLNRIGTATAISDCQVGAGSSTPTDTQTALDSWVAGSSEDGATEVSTFVDGAEPYWQTVITKRFSDGAAAGILSEVGMGWGESGSTLFSRALILDGSASPTTIEILPDETLDVEYTLRQYIPNTDVTGSRTIGGVSVAYVVRAALISTGSYWSAFRLVSSAIGPHSTFGFVAGGDFALGTKYEAPEYTESDDLGSKSMLSYVPNSLNRTMRSSLALENGNLPGGIKGALFVSNCMAFQVSYTPAIPKTDEYVATLDFSFAWARKI